MESEMKFSKKTNELIKKVTEGKKHIKFTVGVLHEGQTTFKLYNSGSEISYESHLYEIGSIGKVFTTSLLAKYLKSGQMSLDDSIAKYIPELEDGTYFPTLKRLALHTAGYPTRYPMTKGQLLKTTIAELTKQPVNYEHYVQMDYEKMIRLAKERKLKDKDYIWSYSNFGMSLLGHAVSIVAEKPFWDLMNDYLNEYLGLNNSFMGTHHPDILTGYSEHNRDVGNWSLGAEDYLIPAGNITSNAEDLLKFAKLNIEENPDYLSLCHEFYDMNSEHSNMGLGWWIDYKNPNIFYHGGNTSGFASMLAFDKEKKSAVVLLANVRHFKKRDKIFKGILENL